MKIFINQLYIKNIESKLINNNKNMTNTYNSQAYNTWVAPLSATWDTFVLDWYWINWDNLYVINKRDRFKTNLKSYDYPINNGKWYISNYYRWRTIELDMLVKAETAWEFNSVLDNVRWQLAKNNVELQEKINWEYRNIKVSTISLPLDVDYYNITYLPFTVRFEALEPFWYSDKYTSHSFLDMTSDTQEEITNEWNVEVDPIITYAYKTASWVSFIRLDINGLYIQINYALTDSDSVIINCKKKTVLINWILTDYDGTFPQLDNWSNIINFTSDGTYDVDTNILYQRNYK